MDLVAMQNSILENHVFIFSHWKRKLKKEKRRLNEFISKKKKIEFPNCSRSIWNQNKIFSNPISMNYDHYAMVNNILQENKSNFWIESYISFPIKSSYPPVSWPHSLVKSIFIRRNLIPMLLHFHEIFLNHPYNTAPW